MPTDGKQNSSVRVRVHPWSIYINPSCNFAASVNMLWFQGGSQTSSTDTSSTASRPSNLFCTSCCNTGPMPQPGAVKVIFTDARKLFRSEEHTSELQSL